MTKRTAARETMLADIATTAIEGGINYWAQVSSYNFYSPYLKAYPDDLEPSPNGGGNVYAIIHDVEDDEKEYTVTIDVIARGLKNVIAGCKYAGESLQKAAREANRTNETPVEMDSLMADEILQAGLFGEIVYG